MYILAGITPGYDDDECGNVPQKAWARDVEQEWCNTDSLSRTSNILPYVTEYDARLILVNGGAIMSHEGGSTA